MIFQKPEYYAANLRKYAKRNDMRSPIKVKTESTKFVPFVVSVGSNDTTFFKRQELNANG
jgi:hypothetical protein